MRSLVSSTTAAMLLGLGTAALQGCIRDPDCGICDPDNLYLEIISGNNYANSQVFLLSPDCEGESCPGDLKEGKYFVQLVTPCEETENAINSPRGPEEHCRLSPMLQRDGLEFIFNNLLDPLSLEYTRRDPTNPQLLEAYDWKTRVVEVRGPESRYNGAYERNGYAALDLSDRIVNLTCKENVDSGQPWHEVVENDPFVCDDVRDVDGEVVPLRMDTDGVLKTYSGLTSPYGADCTTPLEGPDTCCTTCDWILTTAVARYGVDSGGARRDSSNAITCDPAADDLFVACRDFVPSVDRPEDYISYQYDWNLDGTVGADEVFPVPLHDKLREFHPDDRPAGHEQRNLACADDGACPDGAQCVGVDSATGNACQTGATCEDKRCTQEWFAACEADANQTGAQGYCVDKRYQARAAGACYTADAGFARIDAESQQNFPAGSRLQNCDAGTFDGTLSSAECCQASLGGDPTACDPIADQNVTPVERFDKDRGFPSTNQCFCGPLGGQDSECEALIEQFCTPPYGSFESDESNEGEYVTRYVARNGGVIYDPAAKGFKFFPSDLGNYRRNIVERCAEGASLIDERSELDGWRAGDVSRAVEAFEDYDRSMCSGSEYEVVFASEGQVLRDKVGNTLDGRSTYRFKTSEFHVVPGTGFPTDNITIGACDEYGLTFSNKFDMSPENLRKIELVELVPDDDDPKCGSPGDLRDPDCWDEGAIAAGGLACTPDDREAVEAGTAVPCLIVDIKDQWRAQLRVTIDVTTFGKVLRSTTDGGTGRYRFRVPGIGNYASLEDLYGDGALSEAEKLAIYRGAFHDACGMPLVTAGGTTEIDYAFDFTIDPPGCADDLDKDAVQVSCDNDNTHANPEQTDTDLDGFGDTQDLCPTLATSSNTDDADRDGIGTPCDTCAKPSAMYNTGANDLGIMADLQVRNIPYQDDFDGDGIGDVCDNCVQFANCDGYGVGEAKGPWDVGDSISKDNLGVCQTDNDLNLIGDACAGQQLATAAGPVGFTASDDLDQDGIPNADDVCPRQPVAGTVCTDDNQCEGDETCFILSGNTEGVCNHADTDADGVGNICDTCPYAPNPMQITASGQAEDDQDGDFVGFACETAPACYRAIDPRPIGFHEVAVDGQCCVRTYAGDGTYVQDPVTGAWGCEGLCDPDNLPITADCANEPEPGGERPIPDGVLCRKLPLTVANRIGVIPLPPGCEDALADAGLTIEENNVRLTLQSPGIDNDPNALLDRMCFYPQWDQDFDGVGDKCDLCDFDFDPSNTPYVNDAGVVFPGSGRVCNGEYGIATRPECQVDDGGGGGGTDGTDGGGTDGGTGG
jgi:hypothetical protein